MLAQRKARLLHVLGIDAKAFPMCGLLLVKAELVSISAKSTNGKQAANQARRKISNALSRLWDGNSQKCLVVRLKYWCPMVSALLWDIVSFPLW